MLLKTHVVFFIVVIPDMRLTDRVDSVFPGYYPKKHGKYSYFHLILASFQAIIEKFWRFFSKKCLFPPFHVIVFRKDAAAVSGKTCFVATLTPSQMDALRASLESISAWEFSAGPYMLFKASREKTQVAAYRSGKLVVQGAGTQDFVEFVLEPLIGLTQDESEPPPLLEFRDPHAGIDESGKGDFFGPLVVACVFVADATTAETLAKAGVRDSKAIKDDSKIAELAEKVKTAVRGKFGVVVVGPEAYNRTYEAYFALYDEGKGQDEIVRDLLNGPDDTVRFVVSQLADDKYELTVKNFQAALTTRDSWLTNFVPKAILAYHIKRLEADQAVLTRELATVGADRQREIFSTLERINELKKKINIKLGRLK
jgi:ribonuclease HIII